MQTFSGVVSGLDVIASPGQTIRCLAFISRNASDEIQVSTESEQLQSALALASTKKVRVEVSYQDNGLMKALTRVRLLDRDDGERGQIGVQSRSDIPGNIGEHAFPEVGGALIWCSDQSGRATGVAWRSFR